MRNILKEVYNEEEAKKAAEIFKNYNQEELLKTKPSIIDIRRDFIRNGYIKKGGDVNVNRICKYILY